MEEPTTDVQKTSQSHQFCTGSSFIGELDEEGKMSGFGIYRYPNGTEYHGHFHKGVFHGRGMIIHPWKIKTFGYFVNGICENYETFFGDGLQYETDWKYCTSSDRRFWIETVQGISPVGETFKTKEKPVRVIPRGFYDVEEGFFDPRCNYIINPLTWERMRYVCPDERANIIQKCRMNKIDFENRALKEVEFVSTDSNVSSDGE